MASPMIEQFDIMKAQYPDAILFYQVGDFFEMFRDDAIIASKVLDLTLTGKDGREATRVPMCGIPMHAVDNYLPKLVQAGYKVAVCVQGDVDSNSKIMRREVIKIVTPGTITESLDETKNNFIVSIAREKDEIGLAYADITTGKLCLVVCDGIRKLEDELTRIMPSEIIVNSYAKDLEDKIAGVRVGVIPKFSPYFEGSYNYKRAEKQAKTQFKVNSLSVFDVTSEQKIAVCALGGLIEYLEETQKRTLSNLSKIEVEKSKEFLHLDSTSRKNLEITENMSTKKKRGSLLGLYSYTKTNMGARKMRAYLDAPITNKQEIDYRLDGVEELFNSKLVRTSLMELLSGVYDIERLTGKLAYGNISPKECLSLSASLKNTKKIKEFIAVTLNSPIIQEVEQKIKHLDEIVNLIDSAIEPLPPINLANGGYIKRGFNSELDEYKNAGEYGKQWLNEFEVSLKEQTQIKNLRVAYNRVFGYYIEVSKSQLSLVPPSWIRKQTTTNGERYITEELKVKEEKILGAQDKAIKLEAMIFAEVKEKIKTYIIDLQETSEAISTLDVLNCMAELASINNYVRPTIDGESKKTEIIDGRHPVVESLLVDASFVPNDTLLDNGENRTMLITGPNMAGKSTFMRQVALITLMAHIGSFVPAQSATIALTDRIFTRIGASDDLVYGQSTFMVEMTELSNILLNATDKSLLLLDEIGRGTSTYDGLSIAWAALEHLSNTLHSKTLFATHYHELVDLEGKVDGVKNYRVLVRELNDSVVFLHKIARGSANRSFGIEVAKLAGLPASVIDRAKEILLLQEEANQGAAKITYGEVEAKCNSNTRQNVNTSEIISVLSDLDMNTISPLVAFSTLQNLVDKVKKQQGLIKNEN